MDNKIHTILEDTIDNALCIACMEGKTNKIIKLIEDGANADYKYNKNPYLGYTPYMFVIEGAYHYFKNELELSLTGVTTIPPNNDHEEINYIVSITDLIEAPHVDRTEYYMAISRGKSMAREYLKLAIELVVEIKGYNSNRDKQAISKERIVRNLSEILRYLEETVRFTGIPRLNSMHGLHGPIWGRYPYTKNASRKVILKQPWLKSTFVPENAYAILGHSADAFSRTFIVPDNCVIVVKAQPAEILYGRNTILKFCKAVDPMYFNDPIQYSNEIINAIGNVAIYKPGDRCPNFNFELVPANENNENTYSTMFYSVFEDRAGIIPMRDYCSNIQRDANIPLPTSYTKESIVNYLSHFYKFSILPTEDEVKEKLEAIPHPTHDDLRNLLYAEAAVDILKNETLLKKYKKEGYENIEKLLEALCLIYYFETIPAEAHKYEETKIEKSEIVRSYPKHQIEKLKTKIEGVIYNREELLRRSVLMTLNSYLSHDYFLGKNIIPDSEEDRHQFKNHTSTVKMRMESLCSKKPGVYYNFICRYANASDLAIITNKSNPYYPKNVVNPEVYNTNFKYRLKLNNHRYHDHDTISDMLLRRISEGKMHRVQYLKKAYDAKIAETLRNAGKRRRLNANTSKIRSAEKNWARRNQLNKAGIWNKVNGKWSLRKQNNTMPPASSRKTRKRERERERDNLY